MLALRANLWVIGLCLAAAACGPETPAESPSAASAEPEPATEAAPAASAPEASDAAADEAWEGEAEAKSAATAPTGSDSAGNPTNDGKVETRTMAEIQRLVQENRKPVRECFDKAKKELPDLQGDMTIHFVLDPDGKVKKAELNQERSTVKAPPVVECAIAVIKSIKFPPSSRGMDTSVNYPYNFK